MKKSFSSAKLPMTLNGQKLERVKHRSKNLIIHLPVYDSNHDTLVILGSGHSLSIDANNVVVKHDPLMFWPDLRDIKKFNSDIANIYYPFECEGLEQAGIELAKYINSTKYSKVFFIGHSKCGVCFCNAAKYMNNKDKKLVFISISAPFKGTPTTDIPTFTKNFGIVVRTIYKLIFSNHKVDQDIQINSKFIKNADFTGLTNNTHLNIISIIPSKKLLNPVDMFLKYVDYKAKILGDGIVSKSSQEAGCIDGTTKTVVIEATHAGSLKEGIKKICFQNK